MLSCQVVQGALQEYFNGSDWNSCEGADDDYVVLGDYENDD